MPFTILNIKFIILKLNKNKQTFYNSFRRYVLPPYFLRIILCKQN